MAGAVEILWIFRDLAQSPQPGLQQNHGLEAA